MEEPVYAEFNGSPLEIREVAYAESTNDEALAALQFVPAVLVWTLNQTAGRGSRGRSWSTPSGSGLAFSLAFNEKVAPAPNAWCYPIFAGVIWHEALTQLGVADGLSLKWPNDVFWQGRKLAGILCESRWRRTRIHTVIGIGTNLKPHRDLADLPAGFANLSECLGTIDPAKLVATAARCFNRGFLQYRDPKMLQQKWLQHAWIRPGTAVRVTSEMRKIHGSFEGLSPSGELVLKTPEGLEHVQPTCSDFLMEPLEHQT